MKETKTPESKELTPLKQEDLDILLKEPIIVTSAKEWSKILDELGLNPATSINIRSDPNIPKFVGCETINMDAYDEHFFAIDPKLATPNSFFLKWRTVITRVEANKIIREGYIRVANIRLVDSKLPQTFATLVPILVSTISDCENRMNPAKELFLHYVLTKTCLVENTTEEETLQPPLKLTDQIKEGCTLFFAYPVKYDTKEYVDILMERKELARKKGYY